MFVPESRAFDTLGRRILVAWNSSRPAARAVNDALPLIEGAAQVTVLTVNPTEFVAPLGAQPPDRLVEPLRRHGVSVEGARLHDITVHSTAEALQDHAHHIGADLLVAGAFGPPSLWEKLLGGVTCDLLARMKMPILMSH